MGCPVRHRNGIGWTTRYPIERPSGAFRFFCASGGSISKMQKLARDPEDQIQVKVVCQVIRKRIQGFLNRVAVAVV